MATHDASELSDLLADDVVFLSPVVHTPQEGKEITLLYLNSAGKVLGDEKFKYVREEVVAEAMAAVPVVGGGTDGKIDIA